MKKLFFLPILCLFLVVCLKPTRDNEYDPENPDKVYFGGSTHEQSGLELQGAHIGLILDDEIVDSTKSDENGWFEFSEITPDIYKIVARARYYIHSLEFYPESLPAGTEIDTFDLYFDASEMFFDFEADAPGTEDVPELTVRTGNWWIDPDPSGSAFHTVPNVYKGKITGSSNRAICLTDQEYENFFFEVSMKSEESNLNNDWQMGIYFRYIDQDNHYRFRISGAPTHIVLNKVVDGAPTELLAINIPISKNTWYKLGVEFIGSTLKFRLADEQNVIIDDQIDDDSIKKGKLGIVIINPGIIYFDDIVVRTIE